MSKTIPVIGCVLQQIKFQTWYHLSLTDIQIYLCTFDQLVGIIHRVHLHGLSHLGRKGLGESKEELQEGDEKQEAKKWQEEFYKWAPGWEKMKWRGIDGEENAASVLYLSPDLFPKASV